MEIVFSALDILRGEKDEKKVIRNIGVASRVLEVYPEGKDEAAASLMFDVDIRGGFNQEVNESINILNRLKEVNNQERYLDIVEELSISQMLILICTWYYDLEACALNMNIPISQWELGMKLLPIMKSRLEESKAQLFIQSIETHLTVLQLMGWVHNPKAIEN